MKTAMKVILLATQSADGFIGRDTEHLSTTWTTASDKRLFVRITKQAGTVIMGYTTFATFGRALPGRRLIITTRQNRPPVKGVEFTNEGPVEVLRRLEAEGAKSVIVGGGRQIYNQVMQANLMTELYLSIQPVLFGHGIPLFDQELNTKLELLDTTTEATDGTVINHYGVVK